MIGYELVSEEEAAAHMPAGRWIGKALAALRDAGIGRMVKVKFNGDRSKRYSNAAAIYANRIGMRITCRTEHGYLWIEYLGDKDLAPEKAKVAKDILRRLGK